MSNDDTDMAILKVTEGGDLAQVNFAQMKDQVADQVRAFLMNALPRDAIAQLCETAWKNLTQPRYQKPSELEEMITDEMRKQLQVKVNEWGNTWFGSDDADAASIDVLRKLTEVAAKAYLESVTMGIVHTATKAMRTTPAQCTHCGHRDIASGQYCPACCLYSN